MMSRAAWSSSSTEVDVELSHWFCAWVVRLSDSYWRGHDPVALEAAGDLLVEHPAEDRHDEQAEQHRRGDDPQLQGLAPAAPDVRHGVAHGPRDVGEAALTAVPTGCQRGSQPEIGGTGHAQARPALYPTPRTVTTISGCSGSCSIFERSRCTWTLTSRVSPAWR